MCLIGRAALQVHVTFCIDCQLAKPSAWCAVLSSVRTNMPKQAVCKLAGRCKCASIDANVHQVGCAPVPSTCRLLMISCCSATLAVAESRLASALESCACSSRSSRQGEQCKYVCAPASPGCTLLKKVNSQWLVLQQQAWHSKVLRTVDTEHYAEVYTPCRRQQLLLSDH